MEARTYLRWAVAAVVAVACSGTSGQQLPAHHLGDTAPAATQDGVLTTDGTCVLLEAPVAQLWTVIWPPGYTLNGSAVRSSSGAAATLGIKTTLSGGEYKQNQYDFVRSLMDQDLPSSCRTHDFWLATGIVSAPTASGK
jgi:hypothetical protein